MTGLKFFKLGIILSYSPSFVKGGRLAPPVARRGLFYKGFSGVYYISFLDFCNEVWYTIRIVSSLKNVRGFGSQRESLGANNGPQGLTLR